MKTYTLPSNDTIPAIGLGTWKSAPGEVAAAVKEAIACGYRHIDCAHIYQNEAEIGQAFIEIFQEIPREEVWVTSKLWNNAHAADAVRPALEETLKNLQLDYLDLYLIHWPVHLAPGALFPSGGKDFLPYEEIALLETWQALEACVDAGLIRNIGLSNYSSKKIQPLLAKARIAPAMLQVERHPYLQQDALLKFCQDNNIAFTAYSPLGSGDRPAAMKKKDEPVLFNHPDIIAIAEKHKASPGQVLIAWALATNTVVIPKSTNPGRIQENLAAAQLKLDSEDLAAMKGINANYRFVDGSFWFPEGSPYTPDNLWDE